MLSCCLLDRRFASHLAVHVLDSGTLAYVLSDSPVGMLAWILKRWMKWSDNKGDIESVFTKDDLLTHATIFWANNAIEISMRVQHFLDSDRAAWYNHVNIAAYEEGGHFIPWEVPDKWVEDLRRTLRHRR